MSNRDVHFVRTGWADYLYWQDYNPKVAKKINSLLVDAQRDPFVGLGKPELLKRNYTGLWSRRITKEHRLIYRVTDDEIQVIGCRFHYDKR